MKLEITARNAAANGVAALASSGYIRIFDAAQKVLAELRFQASAFKPAVDGRIVSNPIISDKSARASGNAKSFRVFQKDGATAIYGGTVGTWDSGADLELKNTGIQEGGQVSFDELSYEQPA